MLARRSPGFASLPSSWTVGAGRKSLLRCCDFKQPSHFFRLLERWINTYLLAGLCLHYLPTALAEPVNSEVVAYGISFHCCVSLLHGDSVRPILTDEWVLLTPFTNASVAAAPSPMSLVHDEHEETPVLPGSIRKRVQEKA
jgi:hypothetical protein